MLYINKDTSGTGGRYNIHKEEKKEENKSGIKLRRRTVDRSGKYNNVRVRHIIYSKKNIDFHIVDPIEAFYEGLRPKIIINRTLQTIKEKNLRVM